MRAVKLTFWALVATAVLAGPVLAQVDEPAGAPTGQAPQGSIARQLRLKMKLQAAAEGMTLAAVLDHNRQAWQSLSADQREVYRERMWAFRHKEPAEQKRMLKVYDNLIKLSAEKRDKYRRMAEMIETIVSQLDESERQRILALPPQQRARELLRLKKQLQDEGTLPPDSPASAPADN